MKIVVQGKRENVRKFIEDLKMKKPPLARIYDMQVEYRNHAKIFKEFKILKSSQEAESQGSVIPPDVAICDECLNELRNPKDRRFDYFFITCTNCGPRYTTILEVPYDRPNTTMVDFPMCGDCEKEYSDPLDRRFHAQTIACHSCGPKVFLSDGKNELNYNDPIREAGKLIEEGHIVAIKGNGGFHIATSTIKSDPIVRLREKKYRGNKPFAIMAKDLESALSFAEVTDHEKQLLTSYIRPIVLLKKSSEYYLSDLIAPSLDRIGTMLPYTGLHVMLFDKVDEPAFVMTSANPPNEPIVIDNQEAVKKLGKFVDFFLFHNRSIAQRADDSVVRMHGHNRSIIRRSRGFTPEPVKLKTPSKHCILGVGAELNVVSCVIVKDKAFLSQHVGDVEKYESLEFLRNATEHLIRLTNANVGAVACDMHPFFHTTKLAYELAEQFNCRLIPVQHHHSHIASLMGEYGIDGMIGIACDGYGYGLDGSAWGGEILYCSESEFRRVGNLMPQPMLGGDLATKYPLRMVAGILSDISGIDEWLYARKERFPHGKMEVDIILKQMEDDDMTYTTSCGRILDAVSAILGICYTRTYEGEPAMKLESVANEGKDVLDLKPRIRENMIDTKFMLKEIFENQGNYSVKDLAYSAQSYLARALAMLAFRKAKQLDVDVVGFSGGVAYNELFTSIIKEIIEKEGLKCVVHDRVPPGDGGISFGQTVVANFALNNNMLIRDIEKVNQSRNTVTCVRMNYRM